MAVGKEQCCILSSAHVGHDVYQAVVCVRTTHGGVQRDAVHGDDVSGLQNGEGAQPELCHPAVHQRLPSGS